MIANFFWGGSELSYYERASLRSFLKNGFRVRLHTFDPGLAAPDGVEVVNASAVRPVEELSRYTQGGKKASVTSFSNFFRYQLLANEPGWWFDADFVCCQSVEAFRELEATSPGLIAGYEGPNAVNNAVLYISDANVATDLLERAERRARELDNTFRWGAVGPHLVTEYVSDHPERCRILPIDAFYCFPPSAPELLFNPRNLAESRIRGKNALAVHWSNSVLAWNSIPKSLAPATGSYLSELFGEHADAPPPMPARLVPALLRFDELPDSKWEYFAVDLVRKMKNVFRRVQRALGATAG